eukprot:Hpha_TRINITY_DN3456_c0_g2::TRINITY_DN3456_c0_g2_i1::g.32564::m.32564
MNLRREVLTPPRGERPGREDGSCDHLLYRLRSGDYSHWNVRTEPSTSSEVVGLKRNGELITVNGRDRDWLRLYDDSGWVRVSQGSGVWLPVTLASERVPVVAVEQVEFMGTADGGRPTRVVVGRSGGAPHVSVEFFAGGAPDPPPTLPPPDRRVVGGVEWDRGRALTFCGSGVQVLMQWESVPAVLGTLRALFPDEGLPEAGEPVAVARWVDEAAAEVERNDAMATLHAAVSSGHVAVFTGVEVLWEPVDRPWECRSPSPPSGEGAGLDMGLRMRLQRFFQFYRPEKLPSVVPTLLAARGEEEEVFKRLVAKYG